MPAPGGANDTLLIIAFRATECESEARLGSRWTEKTSIKAAGQCVIGIGERASGQGAHAVVDDLTRVRVTTDDDGIEIVVA